ncbi:MAG: GNAT family N-acetyltransferase [Pseudomonadota bacterium]
MNTDIILGGYYPGALAGVIGLHMNYYAPKWGLGAAFETGLASGMGAFMGRYDAGQDLFVMATDRSGIAVGSITVDGVQAGDEGARLRWFIVADAMRGQGLGTILMQKAVMFLEDRKYRRCYLTTFAGLDAARALYEKSGFVLKKQLADDPWSGHVGQQYFERQV